MPMSTTASGFCLAATTARHSDRSVGRRLQAQLVDHDVVEILLVQQHRNLVDVVGVDRGDHGALLDVGEQRDLAALLVRQRVQAAAQQDVRLNTDAAQLLDRVLRRLGLDLARSRRRSAPASDACTARGCGRARRPSGESPRGTAATRCRPPCRRSRPCRHPHRRRPCVMRYLISSVMCGITCTVAPR